MTATIERDSQGRLPRITPAMARMLHAMHTASLNATELDRGVVELNGNDRSTFDGLADRGLAKARRIVLGEASDGREIVRYAWYLTTRGVALMRVRLHGE